MLVQHFLLSHLHITLRKNNVSKATLQNSFPEWINLRFQGWLTFTAYNIIDIRHTTFTRKLNVTSFDCVVGITHVCVRRFFLLRIRQVVIDASTEHLVEACTPVLRPVFDHPDQNGKGWGKNNHYNNKNGPAWILSLLKPILWAWTTVWILMGKKPCISSRGNNNLHTFFSSFLFLFCLVYGPKVTNSSDSLI